MSPDSLKPNHIQRMWWASRCQAPRDVPELVETPNDHPKYGLVLEGTICPWISKRQTQKRKNINALSLQLATFIKVPSQASRTDLWAERGEWEPLKRSKSSSQPGPGPEGLPPTPAEREGWSLQPVTLPYLMPKDFPDPEIILTLQREARPTTGPESPLENAVCPGRAQPNLKASDMEYTLKPRALYTLVLKLYYQFKCLLCSTDP